MQWNQAPKVPSNDFNVSSKEHLSSSEKAAVLISGSILQVFQLDYLFTKISQGVKVLA